MRRSRLRKPIPHVLIAPAGIRPLPPPVPLLDPRRPPRVPASPPFRTVVPKSRRRARPGRLRNALPRRIRRKSRLPLLSTRTTRSRTASLVLRRHPVGPNRQTDPAKTSLGAASLPLGPSLQRVRMRHRRRRRASTWTPMAGTRQRMLGRQVRRKSRRRPAIVSPHFRSQKCRQRKAKPAVRRRCCR